MTYQHLESLQEKKQVWVKVQSLRSDAVVVWDGTYGAFVVRLS